MNNVVENSSEKEKKNEVRIATWKVLQKRKRISCKKFGSSLRIWVIQPQKTWFQITQLLHQTANLLAVNAQLRKEIEQCVSPNDYFHCFILHLLIFSNSSFLPLHFFLPFCKSLSSSIASLPATCPPPAILVVTQTSTAHPAQSARSRREEAVRGSSPELCTRCLPRVQTVTLMAVIMWADATAVPW